MGSETRYENDEDVLFTLAGRVCRQHDGVVGVGGYATNYFKQPSRRWRLRKLLRIVPDLKPGRFCRSGMATPWSFLEPTEAIVEGEWLSGFAMMWKTQL